MSDYPRDYMRTWSVDTMEDHYRAGQVSEEDLTWWLAAWNGTRGRISCAEYRDGAIPVIDHSGQPRRACRECVRRGWAKA